MEETEKLKHISGLMKKMHLVMTEITNIGKSGYNQNQRYAYTTEADTVAAVRAALVKHGISVLMSAKSIGETEEIATSSGGKMRIVRIRLSVQWIDIETGAGVQEEFDGEGADVGDKAIYKAITGAEKYALLKTFLIPTGDDPEKEKPEPTTSAPQAPRKPDQPKPAPTGGREGKKPQEALMDELMAYCEASGLDPERVLYDISNFEDSKNKGKYHYLEIDKVATTSDKWADSALKNLRLLVKKYKNIDSEDIPF